MQNSSSIEGQRRPLDIFGGVKRVLLGKSLRSDQAIHERLSKKVALAVFSSDALSSTAYATEEILLVLAVAVAFGQTIHAYPTGGGAYIVAKENLGTTAGLVAGASLLIDYVLTVSVSIAAGVAALTSAAQGTSLAWIGDYKVIIGVVLV